LPCAGRAVSFEGDWANRRTGLRSGARQFGEGDKNFDVAKKYEVLLGKGVPRLAAFEADSKLVFSQKQGEFESMARIGPEEVLREVEAGPS
jgi:hypothetical protein